MPYPKHKVIRVPEFKDIVYDMKRWELLKHLRAEALNFMRALVNCGFNPIIHGSVARGDVDVSSDIDVVIPYNVESYKVEICLEDNGIKPTNRYIVQATPSSTPKAYIELEPNGLKSLSFPLTHLSPREFEFYRFGGLLTYQELVKNARVPGVTKQLILVVPTEVGHREAPVIGYEGYVAKILRVSLETVKERVEVLSKRDVVGRTGTYLTYVLRVDEDFSEALAYLVKLGRVRI